MFLDVVNCPAVSLPSTSLSLSLSFLFVCSFFFFFSFLCFFFFYEVRLVPDVFPHRFKESKRATKERTATNKSTRRQQLALWPPIYLRLIPPFSLAATLPIGCLSACSSRTLLPNLLLFSPIKEKELRFDYQFDSFTQIWASFHVAWTWRWRSSFAAPAV